MKAHGPVYDPSLPSLGDLRRQIEARHDLPLLRRRDMASAIRTLASWFNLPEENVPASAKYFRDRLTKIHAITAHVSPRRVQNVRSLVLAAMREVGISTKLAPYSAPLSDDWAALRLLLKGDTYAQTELSRFMRYCAHHGIAPGAVTDGVSQAYLDATEAESLIAKPKTRHQSVCRVWNRMVAQHRDAGWPQITLTVPRYDTRLFQIDPSLVPEVLRRDLDAYLAFLGGADVFSGLPKPFRPASLKAVEGHMLRFLSALHHDGMDLHTLSSLADALSPALVKRGLQWLIARSGGTATKTHGEIAWCLRCYAVKHLSPTPETAAFFAEVMPKLRKQQVGLSAKNQSAMGQFDDPTYVERFLLLPQQLWNKALSLSRQQTSQGIHHQKALVLIQTAVLVEILQFAPMRIENLHHLRLDQHLIRQGRRLRISIPANEVKNGQALDFILNEATTERVERYIKEWRRLFLPASNPYLFPGRQGRPKDQSALRRQIEKALWDHAAIRLTPHQFRHAAAKIMLDARPGHYEVVRKLLGHKTMTTTYNHYAGAETQSAIEFYGEILLEQRRHGTTKQMPRRATSAADLFMDPLSPLGKHAGARR